MTFSLMEILSRVLWRSQHSRVCARVKAALGFQPASKTSASTPDDSTSEYLEPEKEVTAFLTPCFDGNETSKMKAGISRRPRNITVDRQAS
jgi:hypothetical protein